MKLDRAQSGAELHELLRICICDPQETPPDWEEKLDVLLSVPGILSDIDSRGTLPIDWFRWAAAGPNETTATISKKLIKAGANPLLRSSVPQLRGTSVFSDVISGRILAGDSLMFELLLALSEAEDAGAALRSQSGETALHIVAKEAPAWMFDAINLLGSHSKIPPSWINAQDQNGCTPLHAFSGKGSFLLKTLKRTIKCNDEMDEHLWEAMDQLIALGADVSIKNRRHVSAASCILHCVEMKLCVDSDAAFRVVAAAQSSLLLDKTQASPMRKSSRRL